MKKLYFPGCKIDGATFLKIRSEFHFSYFYSSIPETNKRKEPNYDYVLVEPLKNLCFETGDMFNNMTNRFIEVVQEYNEAYTALSEELKVFYKKWKELGDNYYR